MSNNNLRLGFTRKDMEQVISSLEKSSPEVVDRFLSQIESAKQNRDPGQINQREIVLDSDKRVKGYVMAGPGE